MERTGWLLDLYADRSAAPDRPGGVVLWMLGEDGERYRLHQPFPVTFYAAGPRPRLRALWRWFQAQPVPPALSRVERRDLFSEQPLTVLAVEARQPAAQPRLFHQTAEAFPDLTYFDADIPLALRYAVKYGVFPTGRCCVDAGEDGLIHAITALDSPWDPDVAPPPLRILTITPDVDPAHAAPQKLVIRSARCDYRLSLKPIRPFLINLRAILRRHDPDLLLTDWGDTWLLPYLLSQVRAARLPLGLNREAGYPVVHRRERSYFSYGQVIHRGRQVHLFGRWHIDRNNAVLWGDYELEGVLEIARVTGLPVQTAARVSPGTGISAMQMQTALRQEILVPWHKQQVEYPKKALEMFAADQGGLVYQPTTGLHHDVAEIDFISMYPGIMVRFNISPETVGAQHPDARSLDALELPDTGSGEAASNGLGLVPQTLSPLLAKRLRLKSRLATLARWDPRYRKYRACASAHKWLLVTCFGYLGYKNARFGRIEAHEAVTAYGREALLRAKESAEEMGFKVLHLYVDGLWVQKPGASQVADFQPVLDAIIDRTQLPIALDGIYRWVAFLPSRQDERIPVANRYFGAFQDGTLKMRGIEARRHDMPQFIIDTQMEVLERIVEQLGDTDHRGDTVRRNDTDHRDDCWRPGQLRERLGPAAALLRRRINDLRSGRVPLEALVVKQKLSRELDEYRTPSPAARAAAQLQEVGKKVRPGQRVRFIYTRGKPGVYAWNLPQPLDPRTVDHARYVDLLLRAAGSIFTPFGIHEAGLRSWVLENALPGSVRETTCRRLSIPVQLSFSTAAQLGSG